MGIVASARRAEEASSPRDPVILRAALGKLEAPPDLAPTFLNAGVQPLAVTLDHAATVETLPWHHRDPFDRMLVAQALTENATLVSQDARLEKYDVPIVW